MTAYYLMVGLAFAALSLTLYRIRRHEMLLATKVEEQTASLRAANEELAAVASDLRRTQVELVDSAHSAGMAEVATDVLHNIGNALTSLQVSASLVESKVGSLPLDFLQNLSALLEEQEHRLPEFFSERRGKLIPQAINRLSYKMDLVHQEILEEMKVLHEQVFQINEIVISQRDYAFAGKHFELVDIRSLIEDVLCLQEAKLEEFQIQVNRDFSTVSQFRGTKTVLLHIVNHLVRNAIEALCQTDIGNRRLTVKFSMGERQDIVLEVADNGVGIEDKNLTAIFAQNWCKNHKNRQRRGNLHYCANAISGMGGAMYVRSDGPGQGARFFVEIPCNPIGNMGGAIDNRSGYDL